MNRDERESEIAREVRQTRKFTPQEAMARMAGPGAMKGASPVARTQQAEIAVATWLGSNLNDPSGALRIVLCRQLKDSELLLNNVDQPLIALKAYCQLALGKNHVLEDIVREADVEWGRMMDERPHFERDGVLDPDDPYTTQSVHKSLDNVLERLEP